MTIYGVDFTSAPRPAKPITIARGRLARGAFELAAIETAADWAAFETFLARSGPWIGGFDFPFGLPAQAVSALAWPREWRALTEHCASLDRVHFRGLLDAYRESRPHGSRYAHRATDTPARSHSPLKLVNPPVALMFREGAVRLARACLTIPGLTAGDPARVAVEAYPGLAARAISGESYKSDDRAKQTPARRTTRRLIVSALSEGAGPFEFALRGSGELIASLVADASGDRLDATLAAMQAGWCWRRRRRNFGLPENIHPLEGWIAMARP